jgi:hypothetical protein
MAWLTDSDRREQEWRRRVNARPDVQEPQVTRLPRGGLRFEQITVQRSVTAHQVVEDVAIGDRRIDRILRGQVTSPHFLGRGRWVVKQCITVESLADAASITVRARGRPVGPTLVHQYLGSSDTIWGRFLTQQASEWADSVIADVASHFADG